MWLVQRTQAQQEEMQAASSAGQADANALRMQLAGAQALCRQLELEVADAQVLPAPCRILWSTCVHLAPDC